MEVHTNTPGVCAGSADAPCCPPVGRPGRADIHVIDLAEQAVDDLLDIPDMTEERAGELIMTARAPWFAEESE